MIDSTLNLYTIYFSILIVGILIGLGLSYLFKPSPIKKGGAEEKNAYIKGINFLLSNETDKAIEEFTRAVKIDSNTIDTYFTLGSLFRSKGDIGRATRIHQSITVRPSVDEKMRLKALYELGVDFKKAGFIKRSIAVFEDLIHRDPKRIEAYEELVSLYQEIKDWEKAIELYTKLMRLKGIKKKNVLAHLYVELGKSLSEKGENNAAIKAFKKAISLDDHCIDAYLHLGDLYAVEENFDKAIKNWKAILDIAPRFAYLAYPRLEDVYFKLGQFNEMERILRDFSRRNPDDHYTHLALARYLYKKQEVNEAIQELRAALDCNPQFLDARIELGRILLEHDMKEDVLKEFEYLLGMFTPQQKPFQCSECGYESRDILWKCPQCQRWDTIDIKENLPKRAAS